MLPSVLRIYVGLVLASLVTHLVRPDFAKDSGEPIAIFKIILNIVLFIMSIALLGNI